MLSIKLELQLSSFSTPFLFCLYEESNYETIIDLQQASNRAIVKIKRILDMRWQKVKLNYLKWSSLTDVQINQPLFQCRKIWDVPTQLSFYLLLVSIKANSFVKVFIQVNSFIIGDKNQIIDIYQIHTASIIILTSDKKEYMIILREKWAFYFVEILKNRRIFINYMLNVCILIIQINIQLFIIQINCIYVSTSGYNLNNGKLMRTFIHPNENQFYLYEQQTIIFFNYSINEFLLEVQYEQSLSLIGCQIMRNNIFQDFMADGTENGELVRRSLPYLQYLKRFQISTKSPILQISCLKVKKNSFVDIIMMKYQVYFLWIKLKSYLKINGNSIINQRQILGYDRS
ncbi:unnamed protein product [Paramecium sonneborni]|uniref:Transmembrane protein n=1 Tax=Paramecium sonneborni TaxID=65129 RepID=A0A8S1RLM1_9CILI|nr:unnamed protein product [Paramecium sonneborni]